jgi:hypothetical protein
MGCDSLRGAIKSRSPRGSLRYDAAIRVRAKWRDPIECAWPQFNKMLRKEDVNEVLVGPDEKDVATGSFVGVGEAVLIGGPKATIAEQHICSEGYDLSSRIINGMSRTVDVLEVMRL